MDCHDCFCSDTGSVPSATTTTNRPQNISWAKRLALITIAWNLFEGTAAIGLGFAAGSVALMGFGLDSAIETASAAIVGWRFWSEEKSQGNVEQLEIKAARTVGVLLLCLAAYITFDAIRKLIGFEQPAKESIFGILLTGAALIVMTSLSRAKQRSAQE